MIFVILFSWRESQFCALKNLLMRKPKKKGSILNFRRGEGFNLREALKVVLIEGQYIGDPVNLHYGNKPRIMNHDPPERRDLRSIVSILDGLQDFL